MPPLLTDQTRAYKIETDAKTPSLGLNSRHFWPRGRRANVGRAEMAAVSHFCAGVIVLLCTALVAVQGQPYGLPPGPQVTREPPPRSRIGKDYESRYGRGPFMDEDVGGTDNHSTA